MQSKRGFTLIELLVVISIISMLSTIVLAALAGARDKARNVKVVGEVYQYVLAIENLMLDKDAIPLPTSVNIGDECLEKTIICEALFEGRPINPDTNFTNQFLQYMSSIIDIDTGDVPYTISGTHGFIRGVYYTCMGSQSDTNGNYVRCWNAFLSWPEYGPICQFPPVPSEVIKTSRTDGTNAFCSLQYLLSQ